MYTRYRHDLELCIHDSAFTSVHIHVCISVTTLVQLYGCTVRYRVLQTAASGPAPDRLLHSPGEKEKKKT